MYIRWSCRPVRSLRRYDIPQLPHLRTWWDESLVLWPVGLRRFRLRGNLPWCCLESSSTHGNILKMSLEKLHYDFYLASLLDLEALQTKCQFTQRRDMLHIHGMTCCNSFFSSTYLIAQIAFYVLTICDIWLDIWTESRCNTLVYRSSQTQEGDRHVEHDLGSFGISCESVRVAANFLSFASLFAERKESRSGRKRLGPLHLWH